MKNLAAKLAHVPKKPGIYLFKGNGGKIIYVGKAKSLRKRLSSYFTRPDDSPKTQAMLVSATDFEYIVTSSEHEAIILESNFIKKHRPRYNILLKDDKSYPYLKLTLSEEWPRLLLVRAVKADGAKYFGPFSGNTVRETLRQIKRLFPIRWCKETPMKARRQPCMYYHIKRCSGPCIGEISRGEYMDMCLEIKGLLEGRIEQIVERIKRQMIRHSDELEFEKAKVLRDRVRSLGKMMSGQVVLSVDMADRDVVAFSRFGNKACALVFHVRGGKLVSRDVFYPHGSSGASNEELMSSILVQYYSDATNIPSEIILQNVIKDIGSSARFLSRKKGGKAALLVPARGKKRELVEMAENNARLLLERRIRQEGGRLVAGVLELKNKLRLEELPARIEAFDVSNIQGTDVVGSMVAFVDGAPLKRDYRKFKVKGLAKQDDVAAIYEIVKRRYSGMLKDELSRPDLVLIDGGVGQVNSASRALRESGMEGTRVIGLSKRLERIHIIGRKTPLKLAAESAGLHLLQRVRDEAHRFAVRYHRLRRRKRMKT
jgi:excinuclease ABC subunit C